MLLALSIFAQKGNHELKITSMFWNVDISVDGLQVGAEAEADLAKHG